MDKIPNTISCPFDTKDNSCLEFNIDLSNVKYKDTITIRFDSNSSLLLTINVERHNCYNIAIEACIIENNKLLTRSDQLHVCVTNESLNILLILQSCNLITTCSEIPIVLAKLNEHITSRISLCYISTKLSQIENLVKRDIPDLTLEIIKLLCVIKFVSDRTPYLNLSCPKNFVGWIVKFDGQQTMPSTFVDYDDETFFFDKKDKIIELFSDKPIEYILPEQITFFNGLN